MAGFSLLEVLAAMAILMMIVVLMGMIFAETSHSWRLGSDKSENNTMGRAAINLIAGDLQYAVADDVLSFVIRPDKRHVSPYGFLCSEICFVSLSYDADDYAPRTAREIFYYVRANDSKQPGRDPEGRYNLIRGYYGRSISGDNHHRHAYDTMSWYDEAGRPGGTPQAVAENVVGLAFYAPDEDGELSSPHTFNSQDHGNALPPYVDIYLEIMDRSAANDLADMIRRGVVAEDSPQAAATAERHLKRYTKRVYFHNRIGYRRRTVPSARLIKRE